MVLNCEKILELLSQYGFDRVFEIFSTFWTTVQHHLRKARSCPSHGFTTVGLVQRRQVVFFYSYNFCKNKVVCVCFFYLKNSCLPKCPIFLRWADENIVLQINVSTQNNDILPQGVPIL